MQDKPIVGTTKLLKKMSVELYEEEQLRNKVIRQWHLSKKSLIIAFVLLIPLSFLHEENQISTNILFFAMAVMLIGFLGFFIKSYDAKIRLDQHFKEKIVTALIQNSYPSLVYEPKGSFGKRFVKKANRYNFFDCITIRKTQDYLHGKLEGVDIKLMEIKKIAGHIKMVDRSHLPLIALDKLEKMQDFSIKNNVFSGIIIVMDFYVDDKSKLQGVMNSSVVQNAIKELDNFWGSYPQVTVDEEGYCVIDISLTKGRQFLEVSQKEKLYTLEYFDLLYKQLDLLLKIPVLVKQELENR